MTASEALFLREFDIYQLARKQPCGPSYDPEGGPSECDVDCHCGRHGRFRADRYLRLIDRWNERNQMTDICVTREQFYGLEIASAKLSEGALELSFADGSCVKIWDDGQSCCECRYTTTDDDPSDLVGGKLRLIEEKPGPELETEYGEPHEQMFVEIATDKCSITLCTHNEHNGYYGGFALKIARVRR